MFQNIIKEVDPCICADVEVSLDHIKCVCGGGKQVTEKWEYMYVNV
jgi:hypothetical protein